MNQLYMRHFVTLPEYFILLPCPALELASIEGNYVAPKEESLH